MRRIILIAGHNGAGTGAKGYIDEGAETIKLRDCLADWLRIKEPNLTVITDRNKDNLTLAGGLLNWLKSFFKKDDICLDLHFNASANETAKGTEVLIPDKYSQFEFLSAKLLVESLAKIGFKSRGVKTETSGQHAKLAMLSGFDCENFLLELCFVSNQGDVAIYQNKFPELLAAIGNWIKECAKI
jgi:N-acetylmuramoyl-L-alanine amidase